MKLFILLRLADVASTYLLIEAGAVELNPIADFLIAKNWNFFFAYQILATAIIVFLGIYLNRKWIWIILNLLSGLTVANNIIGYLLLLTYSYLL